MHAERGTALLWSVAGFSFTSTDFAGRAASVSTGGSLAWTAFTNTGPVAMSEGLRKPNAICPEASMRNADKQCPIAPDER